MFWSTKGNGSVELRKKHLFTALFSNITVAPEEASLTYLVKKMDAPSININFERGLASNYVHYFQQGEINWEPINITFVDAVSAKQGEVSDLRKIFFDYLRNSPIARENRTGVLDLPIFCSDIKITSLQDVTDVFVGNDAETVTDKNGLRAPITDKQEFTIYNPRITKISFGSFDYSTDDSNEITITVIPEWCDSNNLTDTYSETFNETLGTDSLNNSNKLRQLRTNR